MSNSSLFIIGLIIGGLAGALTGLLPFFVKLVRDKGDIPQSSRYDATDILMLVLSVGLVAPSILWFSYPIVKMILETVVTVVNK